ncbi:MAG: hypothetical protein ACI4ND_03590 [Succinivibrio sp.]
MMDFDSLPEDKRDTLVNEISQLYIDLCEQSLSELDEDVYKRISDLYFDNDYVFVISFREVTQDDIEFVESDVEPDFVAEIVYEAEEGSLKNNIHVVDIICSIDENSEPMITWATGNFFPNGQQF